ncbi:MAG TPA: nucleotidyl transferase AbiEii/AbiGii toxin family protein [Chlamydiales bacterium]|nr:nucleotidyl transferase AbiEii/AbiGii toxin family protein [Chlamydiales bacterium]
MSNRNISNVPASVRVKLLNKSRMDKRPFNEILQYYGMERFLYRLSISKHSHKFFLKGALMFKAWNFDDHRATMDIDMLANTSNNLDNLIFIVREICEIKLAFDDGIIFDSKSVSGKESQLNREYPGVQLKFYGELNKARFLMKVDVGFGDVIFPKPVSIHYPSILDFPSPLLKGYTVETVIAEKFETIVVRGNDNSRMKDFYDIWVLQRKNNFNKKILREAIHLIFSNRQTKFHKSVITNLKSLRESGLKGKQWEHFIKKNNFFIESLSFKKTVDEIVSFLESVFLDN